MMNLIKKHYRIIFPFFLALITFLASLVFKNFPSITERFFTQWFYPKVAFVLSNISVYLSFSLDDVIYTMLVLLLLLAILLLLTKRMRFKRFLLRFLQVFAILYTSFYWLWGFNYYRQDAHVRLDLPESKPDNEVLLQVLKEVVRHTNDAYCMCEKNDQHHYQEMLENSYEQLQDFLKIDYPLGVRRIKYITYSDFFAKASIAGYYGPFFNEVHINSYLSVWDVPVVSAHEMSHQFGVTSEAEANFYAWMVCVNSKDRFVNYSGWMYALNFFIYQSSTFIDREKLIEMIRPEVINDIRARHLHWEKLTNEGINRFAGKVNDTYLKSNNVGKGIDDYNGMVQLIVDLYLSDKMVRFFNP
jgi:hypothetical protein